MNFQRAIVAHADGGTSLESVEHDLSLRIEIANGTGKSEGLVTTEVQSEGGLRFVLTTDQSYLAETLLQIEAVLRSRDTYLACASAREYHLTVI